MIRRGTANLGIMETGWQKKVNRQRLRNCGLERTHDRMQANGLSTVVCLDEQNACGVTDTVTGPHP